MQGETLRTTVTCGRKGLITHGASPDGSSEPREHPGATSAAELGPPGTGRYSPERARPRHTARQVMTADGVNDEGRGCNSLLSLLRALAWICAALLFAGCGGGNSGSQRSEPSASLIYPSSSRGDADCARRTDCVAGPDELHGRTCPALGPEPQPLDRGHCPALPRRLRLLPRIQIGRASCRVRV